MADEVTDPHSIQKVLSVCLKLLNHNEIKEFFFEFDYLESATGETVADAIIEASNITISI